MSAMHSAPLIFFRLCPSIMIVLTTSIVTARGLGRSLNRRAGDRSVRAEHAAIAGQALERLAASPANVEHLAGVLGHLLFGLVPAFGAGEDRFRSRHLIASGFVGEPTAPVIGSAGATNMNS